MALYRAGATISAADDAPLRGTLPDEQSTFLFLLGGRHLEGASRHLLRSGGTMHTRALMGDRPDPTKLWL